MSQPKDYPELSVHWKISILISEYDQVLYSNTPLHAESRLFDRAREKEYISNTDIQLLAVMAFKMSEQMDKSTFEITKMDCQSEETLIRMKLDSFTNIKNLDFDLEKRRLTVYHDGLTNEIEKSIDDLKLNSKRIGTEKITTDLNLDNKKDERQLLWTVLLINFGFFAVESITGLISKSMGLVADSLDMLADALVYGLSLYAVGRTVQAKKNVARLSGYFQMILAIVGFIEVIRRFVSADNPPDYTTMIIVSIFALIGNGICLYLLQRTKSNEAHMKASMIFTSNDVIINMGVILAGGLVYFFNSNKPDLIIGTIVFVIVTRGALRILKLSRA